MVNQLNLIEINDKKYLPVFQVKTEGEDPPLYYELKKYYNDIKLIRKVHGSNIYLICREVSEAIIGETHEDDKGDIDDTNQTDS